MTNERLYAQILAFDIDGGPSQSTFAMKLARENGWSRRRTERTVAEYRRFLYLAMVAPHSVSPSDAVDQAWHTHMLYTRSYWERLTQDVLPRPLHHGPSRGGHAEDAKFDDWYGRTLDAYRSEFGEDPPSDVWPAPGAQHAGRFRRVDTGQNWIVPKMAVTRSAAGLGLTVLAGATVVGCVTTSPLAQLGPMSFSLVAIGVGVVVILVVVVSALGRNKRSGPGIGGHGTGFTGGGFQTPMGGHFIDTGPAGHEPGHAQSTDADASASVGHSAHTGAEVGGMMGDAGGHGGHGDSGADSGSGDSGSSGGDSGGGSDGGGSGCGGGGCSS